MPPEGAATDEATASQTRQAKQTGHAASGRYGTPDVYVRQSCQEATERVTATTALSAFGAKKTAGYGVGRVESYEGRVGPAVAEMDTASS